MLDRAHREHHILVIDNSQLEEMCRFGPFRQKVQDGLLHYNNVIATDDDILEMKFTEWIPAVMHHANCIPLPRPDCASGGTGEAVGHQTFMSLPMTSSLAALRCISTRG